MANVGHTRGAGGGGLAVHWLKAKNEDVRPLPARGIGADGVCAQVAALTAETAGATFRLPVLHMWFPWNPSDRKPTQAEKDDLLVRMEREFHLEDQPRIGVQHVLARDMESAAAVRHPSWRGVDEHEHYAWALNRDSGQAVDQMRHSMIRQERVIAEWQHANGFRVTPMKHATPVLAHLDRHNPEAAAAVRAAGMTSLNDPDPGPTCVALYGPAERARMERNPEVPAGAKTRHAFNARKDVLAAWKASDSGRAFEAALAAKGYRLARGERSAVIVDPAGIEHRATEILGTAGRKLDGKAIAAAEVHARLVGLHLPPLAQARAAVREAKAAATPTADAGSAPEASGAASVPGEPTPPAMFPPAPEPTPIAVGTAPAADQVPCIASAVPAAAEAVPDVPASAPPTAKTPDPSSGGAPPTRGGQHADGDTAGPSAAALDTDGDFVAPADPSSPADVERFLRDWARAFAKRQKQIYAAENAARANGGRGHHADIGQIRYTIEQWRDAWRRADIIPTQGTPAAVELANTDHELFLLAASLDRLRATQAVDLEPVRPGETDHRHDRGPGDTGAPADTRLPRDDTRDLRCPARGQDIPGSDRASGTPRTAPGQGADGTRPSHHAAGADRREPDPHRAEAGRRRVRARRTVLGLAAAADARRDRLAALSAALAPPGQRLRAALADSDRRARLVLGAGPWKDPATRDPHRLAADYDARTDARDRRLDAAAAAAMEKAGAAAARVGWVDRMADRLGIATNASKQAREAVEAATAAEAARLFRSNLEAEYRRNRERAQVTARARQAEHDAWSGRSDVVRARRDMHGNELLRDALRRRDPDATALALRDPDAARELVLRRAQQDEIRRRQEIGMAREREASRLRQEFRETHEIPRHVSEKLNRHMSPGPAAPLPDHSGPTPTPSPRMR